MKEFRGKLAIGITVNFVNKNSQQEAAMEEISGVAFIYNQQFFQELKDKTGIDLENIVYYKDDTHYFVMTAKKKSLLEKGVIMTVSFIDGLFSEALSNNIYMYRVMIMVFFIFVCMKMKVKWCIQRQLLISHD